MSKRAAARVPADAIQQRFREHLARNAGIAAIALLVSLAIGMAGYRWLAGLSWIDAFLNASMILGGMGPVDQLQSAGAKVFAGVYAIYCGVVFIATAGLLLAPIGMRILHRFHLDSSD